MESHEQATPLTRQDRHQAMLKWCSYGVALVGTPLLGVLLSSAGPLATGELLLIAACAYLGDMGAVLLAVAGGAAAVMWRSVHADAEHGVWYGLSFLIAATALAAAIHWMSRRLRLDAQALRQRAAAEEAFHVVSRLLPGAPHAVRQHPDGSVRLLYAGPAFQDIVGVDPANLRSNVRALDDLYLREDHAWLTDVRKRARHSGESLHLEHRIMHPVKGLRWLEWHATPLPEPDGGVLWNAIYFDITQRKLDEQALREREARLLGIVDASMDAIVVLDDASGVIVFNPAAEHMFRCAEAGMLGLTLEGFVHSYLHTDYALLLNMLKSDEINELRLGELSNLYGRRSDGETFPLELSVARTQGAAHRLLSMTLRDITERRRTAERLQASQQQLRTALDVGSMGVMKLDTLAGRVELDEQAMRIFGVACSPHEPQSPQLLLHALHAGDRRRVLREYLQAVRTHASFRIECRIVRDSAERWVILRGGVLGEEGARVELMAIVTDVTDRKLLEEQRLRSQKLESLGVLAGGIAHDFNNLLLAITGNLKLAMSDVTESHPAMASLREIDKAALRAADLVRRILAFSRPQDHTREPVTFSAVVDEVLGLARAVLPASIAIRLFAPETSPVVFADATQVHQALINLITNAADAVPVSGGEIEVHIDVVDAEPQLHDAEGQLQAGRRYARITVSDNGSGMDVAVLQRIFDPFFTTKPSGQGTGLGLAIVHGIMKGHQGAVTVHSEVGRGTSFALYFPVYTAPVPPPPVPSVPSRDRSHGAILYVDDEEALVFLMMRTLQRMGHDVVGISSPEEALQLFMQDPEAFDLVVSDMSMPGMSGLELARKVLAANPRVPVIITTGFVRAEDYEAAKAVGVRQLILKPNTIEELGVAIERVLRGKDVETMG